MSPRTVNGERLPRLVKPDGRTTCCGAFSTIDVDSGDEFCRACYETIDGHVDPEATARRYVVDLGEPS